MSSGLKGCWRLDTQQQTLVLASLDGYLPQVVYWGAPLPAGEDLNTVALAQVMDVTGGMVDANSPVTILPLRKDTYPGHAGLIAYTGDGQPIVPDFARISVEQDEDGLLIEARDAAHGLIYCASFKAWDQGLISCDASLDSAMPIRLDWLSTPVLPGSAQTSTITEYTGRWCGEFIAQDMPWQAGQRRRDNPTGRTDHAHFPALILKSHGCANTSGEAWSLHYGNASGHTHIAEQFPDGRRQIQFGKAQGSQLEAGTHFSTGLLYLGYSSQGLNGIAVQNQRFVRDELIRWPKQGTPCPVHYNCWEAVYFDHDLNQLKAIADKAVKLGAERFVLDDGWFGKRDDDTSSLGDWDIDRRKWPDGLTPLIEHVHALGMTFGLWFEPEMVNPDSELYRNNPKWALGPINQTLGRQQMVLDMANGEVQDYLFGKISAVLEAHDIDYVKWDHNRVLPHPDAAQAIGCYDLMDRLGDAFPLLEIESCSSGGGRIDYGILRRTQRVWLSDSNDAIERTRIQHEAALWLPLAVTGSHVGPRHCHTSGRTLDIKLRAWVAAQRHMGFEMDPNELTDEEAAYLTKVTSWWKANRDWMASGDILRLDCQDPAVTAEQQIAADGSRIAAFVTKTRTSDQILPKPVRLTGLDPQASYQISLDNSDERHHLSRAGVMLADGPITASGAFLMSQGLTLPWSFPETLWIISGKKL